MLATSNKKCACKGIRTCLICENNSSSAPFSSLMSSTSSFSASPSSVVPVVSREGQPKEDDNNAYPHYIEDGIKPADLWYYCIQCRDRAYRTQHDHNEHSNSNDYISISGVYVQPNFVLELEEAVIAEAIDGIPWVDSQSGRRKQDFGPKVNFKKKKIKLGAFSGFPIHSRVLLERMKTIDVLADFQPVEMCNLEYDPSRGSAIDPHFDDFWLWGERLVTVNLLSPTCYTLSKTDTNQQVIVPLPSRSLTVLYGDARYEWMHSISRQHVNSRRLGITIRELTLEFLEGGNSEIVGKELLSIAAQTWQPPEL